MGRNRKSQGLFHCPVHGFCGFPLHLQKRGLKRATPLAEHVLHTWHGGQFHAQTLSSRLPSVNLSTLFACSWLRARLQGSVRRGHLLATANHMGGGGNGIRTTEMMLCSDLLVPLLEVLLVQAVGGPTVVQLGTGRQARH